MTTRSPVPDRARVAVVMLVAVLAACGADRADREPGPPPEGGADVVVVVDSTLDRRPISPLVYGFNAGSAAEAPPGASWLRLGGNRWTAYDWETNLSNAGSDWYHSNDTFMGSPADGPAAAALPAVADARANGLGVCVTVPMQGWVARDASGAVPLDGALADHFLELRARKGSAFSDPPDAADPYVYADELAAYLAARFAGAAWPLHLMLDNEPDLWASTHAEIQRAPLSYVDLLARSVEWSAALKDAADGALVLGPASYGWYGYETLQDAPDAAEHGNFLDYYLAGMKAASGAAGRRLLDALDLHFYSEASGCGVRVAGQDTTDCVVAARVQAPRSLWDPSYVEESWITQWSTGGQAIRLVPRMLEKIAAHYPGTLLSLSEYDHGGEAHVSGAVAQADTLGILGEQGMYAAAFWPLAADRRFTDAAWLAYRDYDGAGGRFGEVAVHGVSGDVAHVAVHASDGGAGRLVIVLVHRPTLEGASLDLRARAVRLVIGHPVALATARAWQLTAASPVVAGIARPQRLADPAVAGNTVTIVLPALSVTTLEVAP